MAQPATVQVSSIARPDLTRRKKVYRYAIQMADPGTPTYPAAGILVNLTSSKVLNPMAEIRATWASVALPKNTDIVQTGFFAEGYSLTLEQNATAPTMANFVLRIWTAPGTELGTGSNIPAALFGATIAAAPQLVFDIRGSNWGS